MEAVEIYSILFGAAVVALEILVDKNVFWSKDKNDKPWSTIGRAVLFILWAFTFRNHIYWLHNLLLSYSTFFLLFDWTLNVVRWKELPEAYFWKLRQGVKTTKFEINFLYPYRNFVAKFFYHAAPKKRDKSHTALKYFIDNWYELAYTRIPPQAEVLIKASILLSVILYY